MRTLHRALLTAALAIAGCRGGADGDRATQGAGGTPARTDTGATAIRGLGMARMQMMPTMRAHMDSMMRMSPQQMGSMMAMHERMMSQMMDQMGADMHTMKMSGSPEWNALTDSVKQDLAELPNLKGPELSARMRAHADRVERLMAMHRKMMEK